MREENMELAILLTLLMCCWQQAVLGGVMDKEASLHTKKTGLKYTWHDAITFDVGFGLSSQ